MAVSSDIKLTIYNGALRHLGSRRLASLTESREPRRVLDDIWNNGRVVRESLEMGDWNFAQRSIKIDYDPGIETEFGFRQAFLKPDDFVRLSALAGDEFFHQPFTNRQYADEGRYWLANVDTLYARFVSNRDDMGMDSSLWSAAFVTYLEARMAFDACERITDSRTKRIDMNAIMDEALKQSRGVDGMNDGPKMPPHGSWVMSRGAMNGSRWNRRT